MNRNRKKRDPRRERGAVLIQAAIGMVVLIGCVGLALDGGMAYLERARLSSAVDSAALAAGHAAMHHGSEADRRANAARAAQRYFASAYGKGIAPNVRVLSLSPVIHIRVSAQTQRPLFLMPVLGQREIMIGAEAEVSNTAATPGTAGTPSIQQPKPVDLMMVTDMSSSILLSPNWRHVVNGSKKVFESLDEHGNRVAQIIFGADVKSLLAFEPEPKFNLAEMRRINQLMQRPHSRELDGGVGGGTATGPALAEANKALQDLPTSSRRQSILLLSTDGVANRQCFDPRQPGQPLPVPCRNISGAPSVETDESVAQMREGVRTALDRGTMVLIVGYGQELRRAQTTLGNKTGEEDLLNTLASGGEKPSLDARQTYINDKGMYCWSGDPLGLKACYDKVINVIKKAGTPSTPGTTGPLRLIR